MARDRSGSTVVAAGGVVWRHRNGTREVLLAHRPRYDDWSLPKGKLHDGETDLLAAVREVREEVGAEVAVQYRIGTVRYEVEDGRKKVTFWSMRHVRGEFEPNDEVDEIVWLPLREARQRLTYDLDRSVLQDFASSPVVDSVIVLVRHAKAGKRSEWDGDDWQRPLDISGQRQATELAALLGAFAPTRILAADRTRCIQTVEPLAAAMDLSVHVDPMFSDEAYEDGPSGTAGTLLALAKPGEVTVVSSQGYTIPSLIDQLGHGLRSSETRKGAFWVLTLVDGDVLSVDGYPAP